MKTIDFFYEAQKLHSLKDADMARALNITTAAVANAKKRQHLSAFIAAKCAEMAGLSVDKAVQAAAVEAEHEPEKREWLQQMLKKEKKIGYNTGHADVAQLVEQLIRNQ